MKLNKIFLSFLFSVSLLNVDRLVCFKIAFAVNYISLSREHSPLEEVSLYGWSPDLQVWMIHYKQKQHIFFVGQVLLRWGPAL